MKGMNFTLKPFEAVSSPDAGISGAISRRSGVLDISYKLTAALREIVIPARADVPSRRKGLWEETCFELFAGSTGTDRYWEFNLSPSGHWNVFRFESYRQGMQEEQAFSSLPFSVSRHQDLLRISLQIDLGRIMPSDRPVRLGISAVLKAMNGTLSFWALIHPGTKADFHLRDSFIMEL